MSLLTETLRPEEGAARPLGTVVHIGAGSGLVLADYLRLQAQALVLVEGDPDTAAELRDLAAPLPRTRVMEAVVAPTAGPATWYRYNLPSLNGLAGPERLVETYPRLRLVRQLTLQTQAVEDILATLCPELHPAPATDHSPRHALVIDMPAGAEELVTALPQEALAPFETVLLRTAVRLRTDGEEQDGGDPANWQAHLRQTGFVTRPSVQGGEGPGDYWVAHRPIPAAQRTPSAAERVSELEVELAIAEEALEAEKARGAALEATLTQSQAEAQAREASQASTLAVASARISELEDALTRRPSEGSPSTADLAERLEHAEARLQEHLTLNQRLMYDMQQLQAREQEWQRRFTELQCERDDVSKQLSFALEAQVMRENSVFELHRALAGFLGKRAVELQPLFDRDTTVVEEKKFRRVRAPGERVTAQKKALEIQPPIDRKTKVVDKKEARQVRAPKAKLAVQS